MVERTNNPDEQRINYEAILAADKDRRDKERRDREQEQLQRLQDKGDDDNEKKSYAKFLLGQFYSAISAGDIGKAKAIQTQLSSLGVSAGVNLEAVAEEIHRAEQDKNASNNASAATQALVTAAVSDALTGASRTFMDQFKPGRQEDLLPAGNGPLPTTPDGQIDLSKIDFEKVDGQELRDAFANLELGRMDPDKRKGILERIQNTLGMNAGGLSEEERTRAMIPALQKMEKYNAARILKEGLKNGEKMEDIMAKLQANHQQFEAAIADVREFIATHNNVRNGAGAAGPDGPRMNRAGERALGEVRHRMHGALDHIHTILVDEGSRNLLVSGGRTTNDLVSGLAAAARATMRPGGALLS